MDVKKVVLCDEAGQVAGAEELISAHQPPGQLHLAFSAFVFREGTDEVLLQKRHHDKLFGSLWSNSCCSHPRQHDTSVVTAAKRRTKEEVGIDVELAVAGSFVYRAEDFERQGVEHEHDTVLVGECAADTPVAADPLEIAEWKWANIDDIGDELQAGGAMYTPWFEPAYRIALEFRRREA